MQSAELTNGDVLNAALILIRGGVAPSNGDEEFARQETIVQLQTILDTHTCFSKAAVNEPIFTLRAKDHTAPRVVKYWVKQARKGSVSDLKIESAKRVRRQMKRFPGRQVPT